MAVLTTGREVEEEEEKRGLEKLERLYVRISDLLLPDANSWTPSLTTDDRIRFFFGFMDSELRATLATLPGQLQRQRLDRIRRELLDALEKLAGFFELLLWRFEQRPLDYWILDILDGIDRLFAFLNQQHPFLVSDTASTSSPRYYLPDEPLSRRYHDLRYEFKVLLLYMVTMFPQGCKLDKTRLTWKWASEGLAGTEYDWYDRVRRAERCFFRIVHEEVIIEQAANYRHKPAEDHACYWQIKPSMLRLLLLEWKSAENGFVCTSSMLKSATRDSTQILRRLSLHQPDPDLPTLLETVDLSHTRSLAVSGAVDRVSLARFVYLRVLDLEGWKYLQDEDLQHQICSEMFLLRYLCVRNTRITRLPCEIKLLSQLEVLDISHTEISELPPEIIGLRLLEALDISHTQVSEFPPDMNKLHHLQVLDISHTQIREFPCKLQQLRRMNLRSTQIRQLPKQILEILEVIILGDDAEIATKILEGIVCGSLRSLHTLETLDLSDCSVSFVEAIGAIKDSLKVLAITWSFHQCSNGEYQEALRSSIQVCQRLESLTMHCELGCSMEFLSSLSGSPRCLEKFKVTTGRFVRVPQWIQELKNLLFLQITVCKQVLVDDLEILARLPKLRCLVLGLAFIPEQEIVIESEGWFTKLRKLSVDCPAPWLTFQLGAMPELTYLDLEICSVPPNQSSVPSGITNLGSLQEVVLRCNERCGDSSSVKMTVQAVKRQIANHDRPIELVLVGTQDVVDQPVHDKEPPPENGTPSETQGTVHLNKNTSMVVCIRSSRPFV